MNKKELPSKEYLLSLFEYLDGKLYWKNKPSTKVSVNIGDEAGSLNKAGYYIIGIDSISYRTHRIIWKMFTGKDPFEIDHINHDKTDNRIENLREVSHKENGKNQSKQKNNTSGYCNIRIRKDNVKKKYQVIFRNANYSKSFLTLEEAIQNRNEKYIEFGFHENHGG